MDTIKEPSTKCQICDQEFDQMLVHFATEHDDIVDIITCDICTEKFKHVHEWYLYKHIKTFHEGHKDHNCESCGKSFPGARSLEIHLQKFHENHKLNQKHDSTQIETLKEHPQTVHENSKDYKSESCNKSFSQE